MKVHVEEHTSAIGIGRGGDVTANSCLVAIGQDSSVGDADWVLGGDSSIAKLASRSWDRDGLGVDESKPREGSECDRGMHLNLLLDERR